MKCKLTWSKNTDPYAEPNSFVATTSDKFGEIHLEVFSDEDGKYWNYSVTSDEAEDTQTCFDSRREAQEAAEQAANEMMDK